jgi:hypothetical protein
MSSLVFHSHLGVCDIVLGQRPQLRRQLLPLHLQQAKALQRIRPALVADPHLSHLSIKVACLVPNMQVALQRRHLSLSLSLQSSC